jgi:hypothetical protein
LYPIISGQKQRKTRSRFWVKIPEKPDRAILCENPRKTRSRFWVKIPEKQIALFPVKIPEKRDRAILCENPRKTRSGFWVKKSAKLLTNRLIISIADNSTHGIIKPNRIIRTHPE